jgi:hypothetical protein
MLGSSSIEVGGFCGPDPILTQFHQRHLAASGETVEQYNAKSSHRAPR